MTRSHTKRLAAGIAAALALGLAAPIAGARPVDLKTGGSSRPTAGTPPMVEAAHVVPARANGGDISEWGYVAIGSGIASITLVGLAGARIVRQRQRAAARPRIAG